MNKRGHMSLERKKLTLITLSILLIMGMFVSGIAIFWQRSDKPQDSPVIEIGSKIDKSISRGLNNTSTWDGTWPSAVSNTVFTSSGAGTEASPYLISSAADLTQLAINVNTSTDSTYRYSDKFFKLTSDIDLNNKAWVPIGLNSSYSFKGNFDGDGYIINNFNLNFTYGGKYSGLSYAGFFGYVTGSSTNVFKNINIENIDISYYTSNTATICVGTLIGYSNAPSLLIDNCNIKGKGLIHYSTTTNSGTTYTGSIIGEYYKSSGSISIINNLIQLNYLQTDNLNTATTEISNYTGGIAGYLYIYNGTIVINNNFIDIGYIASEMHGQGQRNIYQYTGGIAGNFFTTNILSISQNMVKCNYINAFSTSDYIGGDYINGAYVGGLFGNIQTSGSGNNVNNNFVNITNQILARTNSEGSKSLVYAGGIVGKTTHTTFSYNLIQSGNIIAQQSGSRLTDQTVCAGGIAGGSNASSYIGCLILSEVTITASYGGTTSSGWIIGNLTASCPTCFKLDTLSSSVTNTNSVSTRTVSQLKSLSTYTEAGWDPNVWGLSPLLNNGYPTLRIFTGIIFNDYIGNGTESAPYEISTSAELSSLAERYNILTSGLYFKLVEDIDLLENPFVPIGGVAANAFTGYFDGNGHTISGLKIDQNYEYVGLFGYIKSGASVKNLAVEAKGNGIDYDQALYVGGIAGYVENGGSITNCSFSGKITGYINSERNRCIGGIAGDYTTGNVGNCLAVYTHQIFTETTSDLEVIETIIGSTAATLTPDYKSAATYTAYGFDMTNVWTISPALNDGYASLISSQKYAVTINNYSNGQVSFPTSSGYAFENISGVLTAKLLKYTSTTLNFVADEGCKISRLTVNGVFVSAAANQESYALSISGITANISIIVEFSYLYTVNFVDNSVYYQNGIISYYTGGDYTGANYETITDPTTFEFKLFAGDDIILRFETIGDSFISSFKVNNVNEFIYKGCKPWDGIIVGKTSPGETAVGTFYVWLESYSNMTIEIIFSKKINMTAKSEVVGLDAGGNSLTPPGIKVNGGTTGIEITQSSLSGTIVALSVPAYSDDFIFVGWVYVDDDGNNVIINNSTNFNYTIDENKKIGDGIIGVKALFYKKIALTINLVGRPDVEGNEIRITHTKTNLTQTVNEDTTTHDNYSLVGVYRVVVSMTPGYTVTCTGSLGFTITRVAGTNNEYEITIPLNATSGELTFTWA